MNDVCNVCGQDTNTCEDENEKCSNCDEIVNFCKDSFGVGSGGDVFCKNCTHLIFQVVEEHE